MQSLENRKQIVLYCSALADKGWVANHDGNITCRSRNGNFLATPTGTAKSQIKESLLLEVDVNGARVSGKTRPFGEMSAHLAVYKKRADINAVIHAHPPNATALACASQNLIETPFIAEAIVSLGAYIPLLPFASPGAETASAISAVSSDVDAVLMQNHGVFCWGANLEQAFLRLELVEHLAKIAICAQQIGGVRPLPQDLIRELLEKRSKSGLGSAADKSISRENTVVACAPAPHSSRRTTTHGNSLSNSELDGLIREEIHRVLRK